MKNTLWLVLALLLVQKVSAQQALYFRLNAGYGIAVNGDILGVERQMNTMGATVQNRYGTLGTGFPLTIGLGYPLNPYIALQLQGTYLSGAITETHRFEQQTASGLLVSSQEASAAQVQLSPALVIQPSATSAPLNPYVRLGLVIPIWGATYIERRGDLAVDPDFGALAAFDEFSAPGLQAEVDAVVRPAFSWGYNAAVGVHYQLKPQLALFLEASYVGLRVRRASYEPTRGQFIGRVDGEEGSYEIVTILAGLPPDLRPEYNYIEYRDEFTQQERTAAQAQSNYGSELNPALSLRTDINMNTLRFNLGIRCERFE